MVIAVHLSSTHLLSALNPSDGVGNDELQFTVKISAEDKPLPAALYTEAADAFCASTEVCLRYVHGWVFTKANPELVPKWKHERLARTGGA